MVKPRIEFETATEEISLEDAVARIEKHIADGGAFTYHQMDVGIKMSVHVLAEVERDWFDEIVRMKELPMWMIVWAQWKRCREQGTNAALILDPSWRETSLIKLEEKECQFCHKKYMPTDSGALFCSNRCGAEAAKSPETREQEAKAKEPEILEGVV